MRRLFTKPSKPFTPPPSGLSVLFARFGKNDEASTLSNGESTMRSTSMNSLRRRTPVAIDLDRAATNGEDPMRLDPAPSPVDIAHERSATLMTNLTSQALDQLRQFRDDTDALMIALTKRHD